MDRDIDVRTPESVAFTYRLAGLGSRFLALLVDQLVQVFIVVALFAGLELSASHIPGGKSVVANGFEKFGEALGVALLVAVVFAIFFGYFIVFEALWNGQTPGKKALGIRVVRDGGYPIDFGASMVRNLIRVGEFALGYYLLSAISTLVSSENKRLGDLAAGTIVVRDASLELTPVLRRSGVEPAYASTTYLSGEERVLIKRFLERRDALDGRRRRELAAALTARIRERVPPELAGLGDEALLERL
jgi:uncharacterized RDD family membrane protein YckC